MQKFGKCKDLIGNDLKVPEFNELGDLAQKLAKQRNTAPEKEYKSLVKQKILIKGLPYIFSIGVMGFFVAGMTVHFTKKRYEKSKAKQQN